MSIYYGAINNYLHYVQVFVPTKTLLSLLLLHTSEGTGTIYSHLAFLPLFHVVCLIQDLVPSFQKTVYMLQFICSLQNSPSYTFFIYFRYE